MVTWKLIFFVCGYMELKFREWWGPFTHMSLHKNYSVWAFEHFCSQWTYCAASEKDVIGLDMFDYSLISRLLF